MHSFFFRHGVEVGVKLLLMTRDFKRNCRVNEQRPTLSLRNDEQNSIDE